MKSFKRHYALLLVPCIFGAFAGGCKKSDETASDKTQVAPRLDMPAVRSDTPIASSATPQSSIHERDAEFNRFLEKRYANDPAQKAALLAGVAELNAEGDAEERMAQLNHQTMVTPAPADFKPEPSARKIRLKLTLEKSVIHRGEKPRFRLELTNVGKETIDYREAESSIFKYGDLNYSKNTIRFFLIDTAKKRTELLPQRSGFGAGSPSGSIILADTMTVAEKEEWLKTTSAESKASTQFSVTLSPGETLRSVGDPKSPGYWTLRTRTKFDTPGRYQIQVELDDRPRRIDYSLLSKYVSPETLEWTKKTDAEKLKNALGPVQTQPVSFEVAP